MVVRWTLRGSLIALLAGCNGDPAPKDSGAASGDGCGSCAADGEICVVYADGSDFDDWRETCAATPDACTGDDPCGNPDCVAALYDSCDEGYFGQANSCSGTAVTVTCSPDTTSR